MAREAGRMEQGETSMAGKESVNGRTGEAENEPKAKEIRRETGDRRLESRPLNDSGITIE